MLTVYILVSTVHVFKSMFVCFLRNTTGQPVTSLCIANVQCSQGDLIGLKACFVVLRPEYFII